MQDSVQDSQLFCPNLDLLLDPLEQILRYKISFAFKSRSMYTWICIWSIFNFNFFYITSVCTALESTDKFTSSLRRVFCCTYLKCVQHKDKNINFRSVRIRSRPSSSKLKITVFAFATESLKYPKTSETSWRKWEFKYYRFKSYPLTETHLDVKGLGCAGLPVTPNLTKGF